MQDPLDLGLDDSDLSDISDLNDEEIREVIQLQLDDITDLNEEEIQEFKRDQLGYIAIEGTEISGIEKNEAGDINRQQLDIINLSFMSAIDEKDEEQIITQQLNYISNIDVSDFGGDESDIIMPDQFDDSGEASDIPDLNDEEIREVIQLQLDDITDLNEEEMEELTHDQLGLGRFEKNRDDVIIQEVLEDELTTKDNADPMNDEGCPSSPEYLEALGGEVTTEHRVQSLIKYWESRSNIMANSSGSSNPNSGNNNMTQLHLPMMSMVPTNLSIHSTSSVGLNPASGAGGNSTGLTSIVSNPSQSSHAQMAVHYPTQQQHNLQLQQGQVSGQIQIQGPIAITPKAASNQSYVVSSGQVNLPQRDMADESISMTIHHLNNNDDNGGSSVGQSDNSQSEQRLKVEDALNYLDQVKYKFGNQPQVYNDFLDIMKEFKSQSIDTPGVISRVSNLFRGHPELIVGFNTFLPPGYKIEVSLSVVGQNHGYVVTTVQTGPQAVSSGGAPPGAQIGVVSQQQNVQGIPVRPSVAHTTLTANVNNGRVSPPQPTNMTVTGSNNFEGSPSSAFTHSFSSPFVQSAFPSLQSQPVEFNHAINYVNKIKHRFHGQPDKYKQFLDILHTYQKEQRNIKDGLPLNIIHLTEHEVYTQVSKLFENQEDLLQEFGQFLPDATNNQNTEFKTVIDQAKKSVKLNRDIQPAPPKPAAAPTKRPTLQAGPPPKKSRTNPTTVSTVPDVPLSEAEKYGTLNEFALFDKIRHTMKCYQTYENFLRCLKIYNDELINRMELINLVQPILGKHTKLFSIFKGFLYSNKEDEYESVVPAGPTKADKLTDDQIMEIDFSTCKRLGASYCALPNHHFPPMCSGRSDREKDVLNDVWVSFPTWSEDSTFVNSRKTQFEEYVYRCEDERFELDVVIETNASTIRVLELSMKKMSRMTPEELKNFRLEDNLGGSSDTIHQRAIRRLYGDKATEIIEGLKNAPALALPIVLRRLRSKETEWRDAQKSFNKVWREQMEKFYLKSLDHQGITFKQTDVRALRPKALISEIETVFEERQENVLASTSGSHLVFQYGDRSILNDTCNLLLHHVRRQSGIQKEDKRRVKQILKHFLADIFHHERLELSDDENDEASPDEQEVSKSPPTEYFSSTGRNGNKKNGASKRGNGNNKISQKVDVDGKSTAVVIAPSGLDTLAKQDSPQDLSSKERQITTRADVSRRTLAKGKPSLYHKYVETRGVQLQDSEKEKAYKQLKVRTGGVDTIKLEDDGGPQPVDEDWRQALTDWQTFEAQREATLPGHEECIAGGVIDDTFIVTTDKLPIPLHALHDESYILFYANKSWYVFLRFHQILCERLNRILECTRGLLDEEMHQEGLDNPTMPPYKLKWKQPKDLETVEYYSTFLDMVKNLLDGNLEASTYEDTLREMFGIHAYVSYTLDKVITNAVRQLQSLVTDELSLKCLDLYHQFSKKGGTGGLMSTRRNRLSQEIMYRKNAELACENEGCIKVVIFKAQFRMTLELLMSEAPKSPMLNETTKRAHFLACVLNSDSREASKVRMIMGLRPFLLARNRKCESRIRRNRHDYLARAYHQGAMPKFYCPKENINKTETSIVPFDIDLDLLHNPNNYKYLYDKDIVSSIVIPSNFISIPPLVRNALIQKPLPSVSRQEQIKKTTNVKYLKFEWWYRMWGMKNVSPEQTKDTEDWLWGDEKDGNISCWSINEPNKAPFRTFNKYLSRRPNSLNVEGMLWKVNRGK